MLIKIVEDLLRFQERSSGQGLSETTLNAILNFHGAEVSSGYYHILSITLHAMFKTGVSIVDARKYLRFFRGSRCDIMVKNFLAQNRILYNDGGAFSVVVSAVSDTPHEMIISSKDLGPKHILVSRFDAPDLDRWTLKYLLDIINELNEEIAPKKVDESFTDKFIADFPDVSLHGGFFVADNEMFYKTEGKVVKMDRAHYKVLCIACTSEVHVTRNVLHDRVSRYGICSSEELMSGQIICNRVRKNICYKFFRKYCKKKKAAFRRYLTCANLVLASNLNRKGWLKYKRKADIQNIVVKDSPVELEFDVDILRKAFNSVSFEKVNIVKETEVPDVPETIIGPGPEEISVVGEIKYRIKETIKFDLDFKYKNDFSCDELYHLYCVTLHRSHLRRCYNRVPLSFKDFEAKMKLNYYFRGREKRDLSHFNCMYNKVKRPPAFAIDRMKKMRFLTNDLPNRTSVTCRYGTKGVVYKGAEVSCKPNLGEGLIFFTISTPLDVSIMYEELERRKAQQELEESTDFNFFADSDY